ncbi:ROK family protein [Krasilnikoviella flava]|uniref:Sugar kinase of the NBD/HSP70 family, may contain an N-terminal HTH domain n=1 Tax=Krasilnikoviella flava TaxID=526729 RepID=A0A1T5M2Z3_9MICO|nr:ROK family protein [Krasilnikoviella flava]SKC82600.1 Sugar kinase of the NBD/HSP70 family, may contain an N-terminal HTH domain [Krasilnikoviella flava]
MTSGPVRVAQKATPAELRERNTRLVLQSVLSGAGEVSRADIARSVGLARAVVSEIVQDLVARHLVAEGTGRPQGRGKPATPLQVDTQHYGLLMADVTPAGVRAGVGGLDGTIGPTAQATFPAGPTAGDVVDVLASLLAGLAARDGREVLAAGVAVPGIVSPEGRVTEALQLGWEGVDLAGPLSAALGHDVVLVNDATAVALSEVSHQGAPGAGVVVLHVDTGVGSAVLLDGRVHLGDRQRAGEVGHIDLGVSDRLCACGRRGCLETVAGLPAVLEGLPLERLDDVASLRPGRAPDPVPAELAALVARVDRAAEGLAALICAQVAILDVADVVVDGPVRRAGPRLLDTIEAALARRLPPSDVRRPRYSALGERAVMHGAGAAAMLHRLGVMWLQGPEGAEES